MIIITIRIKKECRSKLEYLLFKMLIIRKKRPKLYTYAVTLFARNSLCEQSRAIISLFTFLYVILTHTPFYIYNDIYVNFSTFDNDDMKSSILLLLILFLKNFCVYIYIYTHPFSKTFSSRNIYIYIEAYFCLAERAQACVTYFLLLNVRKVSS